jgi:hypothetical protein
LASHLAVSIPVVTVVFGVLGPLIGMAVMLLPLLIAVPTAVLRLLLFGSSAFVIGGLAAIATGAIVAASSPHLGSPLLFRLLAAFVGALAVIVWGVLVHGSIDIMMGFPLLGAGVSVICTQVVWDWPLQRKSGLGMAAGARPAFGGQGLP